MPRGESVVSPPSALPRLRAAGPAARQRARRSAGCCCAAAAATARRRSALRYPLVEARHGRPVRRARRLRLGPTRRCPPSSTWRRSGVALALIDLDVRRLPDVLDAAVATRSRRCCWALAAALDGDQRRLLRAAARRARAVRAVRRAGARPPRRHGLRRRQARRACSGLHLAGSAGARSPSALFAGFLLGGVVGVGAARRAARGGRKSAVPFGPFMLAGALLAVLVGERAGPVAYLVPSAERALSSRGPPVGAPPGSRTTAGSSEGRPRRAGPTGARGQGGTTRGRTTSRRPRHRHVRCARGRAVGRQGRRRRSSGSARWPCPRARCATARSSTSTPWPPRCASSGRRPGFSTKRVVVGVANQRVVVRQVDLPWLPPAELRASLRLPGAGLPADAGRAGACSTSTRSRSSPTSSGGRVLRVLLVAAARDMVASDARRPSAGRPAPRRASTSPPSRCCAPARTPARPRRGRQAEALVDVGASVTNIVVHQGGVPRFVRILLMGGGDVTAAVAERLGVPPSRPRAQAGDGLHRPPARTATPARAPSRRPAARSSRRSAARWTTTCPRPAPCRIDRLVLSGGGSPARAASPSGWRPRPGCPSTRPARWTALRSAGPGSRRSSWPTSSHDRRARSASPWERRRERRAPSEDRPVDARRRPVRTPRAPAARQPAPARDRRAQPAAPAAGRPRRRRRWPRSASRALHLAAGAPSPTRRAGSTPRRRSAPALVAQTAAPRRHRRRTRGADAAQAMLVDAMSEEVRCSRFLDA